MSEKQKLGPRQQMWVNALRSGQYDQGRTCLRDIQDKFCCLGVACDLFNKSMWEPPKIGDESMTFDGWTGVVSDDAKNYYGFRSSAGSMVDSIKDGPRHFATLTELNDKAKLTFAEIADLVEGNPKNFFVEPR